MSDPKWSPKGPKLPHKYVIYDKIHRGAVIFAMSFTAIVSIRMIIDMMSYTRVKKPVLLEKARYEREIEFEEMRAQREAEEKIQSSLQKQVEDTA